MLVSLLASTDAAVLSAGGVSCDCDGCDGCDGCSCGSDFTAGAGVLAAGDGAADSAFGATLEDVFWLFGGLDVTVCFEEPVLFCV